MLFLEYPKIIISIHTHEPWALSLKKMQQSQRLNCIDPGYLRAMIPIS